MDKEKCRALVEEFLAVHKLEETGTEKWAEAVYLSGASHGSMIAAHACRPAGKDMGDAHDREKEIVEELLRIIEED